MANAKTSKAEPDQTLKAVGLVLFAWFLFSLVDTSTKWLIGAGLAVFQLAFMRYFIHFAITVAETGVRVRSPSRLPIWTKGLVVLRAFCLVSSTVANFIALQHLPLALTSTIMFTSPVIVCVLAWFVLGERLNLYRALAVILGAIGVSVILNPFGTSLNWYAVLMLYPATGMALYTVLTRLLIDQVTPLTMQITTGALGSIALLPLAYFAWIWPQSLTQGLLLIAIGAFAWAGHEILTRAHAYADASFLAPFGYCFILYLTFWGWLVFNDVPDGRTIFGSFLVLLSALVLNRSRPSGLSPSS